MSSVLPCACPEIIVFHELSILPPLFFQGLTKANQDRFCIDQIGGLDPKINAIAAPRIMPLFIDAQTRMGVTSVNITGNFREVSFVIDQVALVTSFKQGSSPFVSAIEIGGIACPQALHHLTYIPFGGLYKEMNLTVYQQITINPEPELSSVTTQEIEIMPSVLRIPEQELSVVRPNYQMIKGTLELDSQLASYKKIPLPC